MTDSLKDLLNKRNKPLPDEITIIKDYVQAQFSKSVGVAISKDKIRIETNNSALAGELRFRTYEIQKLLPGNRRLIIRIV